MIFISVYLIKCNAAPKSSIVCDSLSAIATFSTPPNGSKASRALLPNSFSKQLGPCEASKLCRNDAVSSTGGRFAELKINEKQTHINIKSCNKRTKSIEINVSTSKTFYFIVLSKMVQFHIERQSCVEYIDFIVMEGKKVNGLG